MPNRRPTLLLWLSLVLPGLPNGMQGQSPRTLIDSTGPVDEGLRSFLIARLERWDPYLDPDDSSFDAKTRYAVARVQLSVSGPPVEVVFLVGQPWCGTSGCTTLVIRDDSGTRTIRSEISLTREPISAMSTVTNGWRDLRALSVGGGKLTADWATYRYDRHEYRLHGYTPMSTALDSGQVLLRESTPLHLLYRCRRHLIRVERRDCGLPKPATAPGRRI